MCSARARHLQQQRREVCEWNNGKSEIVGLVKTSCVQMVCVSVRSRKTDRLKKKKREKNNN